MEWYGTASFLHDSDPQQDTYRNSEGVSELCGSSQIDAGNLCVLEILQDLQKSINCLESLKILWFYFILSPSVNHPSTITAEPRDRNIIVNTIL